MEFVFSVLSVVCYLGFLLGVSNFVGAVCGWTHNPQLHTRPATSKTTGMYFFTSNACNYPPRPQSYNHALQTGYLTHRPSYTLQKKKPTNNTHTLPPWHSTHLVKNLDNTRHLRLRTQIPQKLTKTIFYIFTARNNTGSNHCIILLSSWWWT